MSTKHGASAPHYELKYPVVRLNRDMKKGDLVILSDPPTLIDKATFNALYRQSRTKKGTAQAKQELTGSASVLPPAQNASLVIEQQKIKILACIRATDPPGLTARRIAHLVGFGKEKGAAQIHHRCYQLIKEGKIRKVLADGEVRGKKVIHYTHA